MAGAQVWKNSKFTIDRNQGKAPGTVIFRLSGPFTARDMHGALSPNDLRNTFESEEEVIQQHLEHVLPAFFKRLLAPFPYWRWFKLPAERALGEHLAALSRAVQDFIAQARSRMASNPELRTKPTNLIEAMIAARDTESSGLDDQDVAGNVLTMLLAGEDTTANTLAWAIWFLSRNPEAYDIYLRGLFFSDQSTEEALRQSLKLFQEALEKDPQLGRAWTGLAKSWLWLADAYVPPREAYPKVREAAVQALKIDNDDAEAHVYLGETKRILDWDMDGAAREFCRAVELDPKSTPSNYFSAAFWAARGEREEALTYLQRTSRIDPASLWVNNSACELYRYFGLYDEAIAAGERALQLDPAFVYGEPLLAALYREMGRFDDAIALYKKAENLSGRNFKKLPYDESVVDGGVVVLALKGQELVNRLHGTRHTTLRFANLNGRPRNDLPLCISSASRRSLCHCVVMSASSPS